MGSGDWIALAAAIFAGVSGAGAIIAYRLQRRTQATSDEQQLNDLIEKMQKALGSLDSSRTMTLKTFAANNVALVSLRGQALEARKVIGRAGIEPDWFQSMILAYAFSQTWDLKSANPHWENAVKAADANRDHPAHVASLVALAQFYYNRGRSDDWDLARQNFEAATRELLEDPDGQGPDLAAQQAAMLHLQQAGFELDAEGETAAVPLMVKAFATANTISARWRQRTVLKALADLVRELQQTLGQPDLFRHVAAELSRAAPGLEAFPEDITRMLASALTQMPPDGTLFRADLPADEP
jgi:tetratricopeptide (TPR) repeat protein